MKSLSVVLVLLVACAGDAKDTTGDASNVCTGQPYDSCRDEHNCLGANCRPFGTAPDVISVCTTSCTGTECPMQDGMAVPCMNNLCQPPKANSCTLP